MLALTFLKQSSLEESLFHRAKNVLPLATPTPMPKEYSPHLSNVGFPTVANSVTYSQEDTQTWE